MDSNDTQIRDQVIQALARCLARQASDITPGDRLVEDLGLDSLDFIDLMFAFGAITYAIDRYFHPYSTNPADFYRLVLYFVAFLIIDFAASTLAFLLERKEARLKEDWLLLSQVWLQRFAYRQLFSIVLIKTLKRAIDGRPFSWDKLERTAAPLPMARV